MADLFMYSKRISFLDSLTLNYERKFARSYNLTCFHINDIVVFTTKRFIVHIKHTYRGQLTISETTESEILASYLDLAFNPMQARGGL